MDNVRYKRSPKQSSASVDLSHAVVPTGRAIMGGATLLDPEAYGDWTVYVVRQTERIPLTDDVPGSLYERAELAWRVLVGHERVGVDALLGLAPGDPAFAAGAQFDRGLCVHVVGSELSVRYEGQGAGAALYYPQTDRLLAWVAPGRPSESCVPGVAYMVNAEDARITGAPTGALYSVPWIPVPTFACDVSVIVPSVEWAGLPLPVWALFADWRGSLTLSPITVGVLTTTDPAMPWSQSAAVQIPLGAKYMALVTPAVPAEGEETLPTNIQWRIVQ